MERNILETTLYCIEVFGAFLLLYMGTFIKTKYFRYSKLFFAVLLIGALLKITHWSNSFLVFAIGFSGILVLYALGFIQKPVKVRLDYLKMAWVAVTILCRLLIFYHLISHDYHIISQIIMFFALLEYFRTAATERHFKR